MAPDRCSPAKCSDDLVKMIEGAGDDQVLAMKPPPDICIVDVDLPEKDVPVASSALKNRLPDQIVHEVETPGIKRGTPGAHFFVRSVRDDLKRFTFRKWTMAGFDEMACGDIVGPVTNRYVVLWSPVDTLLALARRNRTVAANAEKLGFIRKYSKPAPLNNLRASVGSTPRPTEPDDHYRRRVEGILAKIGQDIASAPPGQSHDLLLTKSGYAAKLVNGCPGMGYADFERALLGPAISRVSTDDRPQVLPAIQFAWKRESGKVYMPPDRDAPVKEKLVKPARPAPKGKLFADGSDDQVKIELDAPEKPVSKAAQALKDPVVEQVVEENAATTETSTSSSIASDAPDSPDDVVEPATPRPKPPLIGAFEEEQWRGRWVLANNGKDRKGLAIAFSAMGVRVRLNERAAAVEYKRGRGQWKQVDDYFENDLRCEIEERFAYRAPTMKEPSKLKFGTGKDGAWYHYVGAILHHRRVDPLKRWFDRLPKWDGVKRIHMVLQDRFEAEDEPLTRWASYFIFAGPLERTYEPGAKQDEMPVLMSRVQGIGKSTLLRLILPQFDPRLYTGNFSLNDRHKERVEATQGRAIVEVEDMEISSKADVSNFKKYLSATDDGSVRLAYARRAVLMLRMFSFIATTNKDRPLPYDVTGNRRFVPVILPRTKRQALNEIKNWLDQVVVPATFDEAGDLVSLPVTMREMLWAEAYHYIVIKKKPAHLPPHLHAKQDAINEGLRHRDDVAEDAIRKAELRGPMGIADIMLKVNANRMYNEISQPRLRKALQSMGWTYDHRQRRIDGKVVRPFIPPAGWADEEG